MSTFRGLENESGRTIVNQLSCPEHNSCIIAIINYNNISMPEYNLGLFYEVQIKAQTLDTKTAIANHIKL